VRQSLSTVIVGRRALLREGIASLLQHTAYKVVAGAAGAAELEDLRFPPGRRMLAILGIDGTNGNFQEVAESIQRLRSLTPDGKIVLVAETSGPVDLQRILGLAPDGYILNLGSRDILVKAIELAFMDQQVLVLGRAIAPRAEESRKSATESVAGSLWPSSYGAPVETNGSELSQRERQILNCLAQGESNKAIARLCKITESTVKVHLKAILRKTRAQNRTQAAIWAMEHGFRNPATADYPPLQADSSGAHEQTLAPLEVETSPAVNKVRQ
jgi:two-component system, NarL family, nitrate/nitrite response regulator NarL